MVLKKIFYIVVLLCVSCTDDQITNTNEDYFNVSGKIITLNDDEDKSNIEVIMSGESIQKDSTDSFGNYLFEKVAAGNYQITVRDLRYAEIDTNVIVDTNLSIDIYYNNYLYNYFPLKIGNIWNFKFEYDECKYCYSKTTGDLEWELKNIIETRDSTLYKFTEKIAATYIKYHYDSLWTNIIIDSTYEINKTDEIKFSCTNSKYLNQLTEHFISSLSWIEKNKIQTIFPISSDSIQVISRNSGIIMGGYEGHIITIVKDLGITNWKVIPGHNGGPNMLLWLADYQISK